MSAPGPDGLVCRDDVEDQAGGYRDQHEVGAHLDPVVAEGRAAQVEAPVFVDHLALVVGRQEAAAAPGRKAGPEARLGLRLAGRRSIEPAAAEPVAVEAPIVPAFAAEPLLVRTRTAAPGRALLVRRTLGLAAPAGRRSDGPTAWAGFETPTAALAVVVRVGLRGEGNR